MTSVTGLRRKRNHSGKLRIGDDWNAITIIALSQNNPLKAVAEFVENSIDAGARHITVTRGKEQGELYLRVTDDGDGVPKDDQGVPNFRYVATHICDYPGSSAGDCCISCPCQPRLWATSTWSFI